MWAPGRSVVLTNLAVCRSADSLTPPVSTPCAVSQSRYSAKSPPTDPTSSGRRPRQPRPKAMFAATPPRRISRLSTRNERATLSSLAGIRCSAKLPGKGIRWSVAIDPVTAIRSTGDPSRRRKTQGRSEGQKVRRYRSVEGVSAGARTPGVRVVDREALLLDRVDEVDGRAGQVRGAHLVGDDLDAAELADDVAVDRALVEVQLVLQAGAAARLHRDTQPQVVAALLRQQVAHLVCCHVGEHDSLLHGLVLDCHLLSAPE